MMRHPNGRIISIISPDSRSLGIALLRGYCQQANVDFAAAKETI